MLIGCGLRRAELDQIQFLQVLLGAHLDSDDRA